MSKVNKPKYDKLHETDVQMLTRIGKKFAILIICIMLLDQIIDLLSSVLDVVLDILHIAMELAETGLEWSLEMLLDTEHHQNETLLINVLLLIIAFLVFRLIINLPRINRWVFRRCKAAWLWHRHKERVCWHRLPMDRKIKIWTTYLTGMSCVLFLLTM